MRFSLLGAVLAGSLCMGACRSPAKKPPQMAMGWRPVGTWSGQGSTQTEEFDIHTGQFRVKWSTSGEQAPGKGRFKLVLHSSVSGRWVADDADVKGVSSGVAYHAEDPRQFFLDIQSSGLDWKITVEEGEMGEIE